MIPPERILVHVCCASCASYVLDHLAARYAPTAWFYNPNVFPPGEYRLRRDETRELCRRGNFPFLEGPYEPERWEAAAGPYRDRGEKSERCWACYGLRLDATAREAARLGFPLFTSTLSVSPHKIHPRIVEAGERAAAAHGTGFLAEDFKKKDGFRKSVEQSRELGFTRQDYCGCEPSLAEARERRRRKAKQETAAAPGIPGGRRGLDRS